MPCYRVHDVYPASSFVCSACVGISRRFTKDAIALQIEDISISGWFLQAEQRPLS